jgi:hypothetical protein
MDQGKKFAVTFGPYCKLWGSGSSLNYHRKSYLFSKKIKTAVVAALVIRNHT